MHAHVLQINLTLWREDQAGTGFPADRKMDQDAYQGLPKKSSYRADPGKTRGVGS